MDENLKALYIKLVGNGSESQKAINARNIAIYERHSSGELMRSIASDFGLSAETISRAIKRVNNFIAKRQAKGGE